MAKTRRHLMAFEVSAEEERLIEGYCKRKGLSKSEFIRGAIYLDLITGGDPDTLKFVASEVGKAARESLLFNCQRLKIMEGQAA